MRVELLWFRGCPSHDEARELLKRVIAKAGLQVVFDDIDASEQSVADAVHFPGSPTIRVDGMDIEPGFVDPGDYTPRCRVYTTGGGLRGVPPGAWIEAALKAASDK